MRIGSEYTAEEIEKNEPHMSKPVLDIIAEYPEIDHVADDMQQSAMHEHGGK